MPLSMRQLRYAMSNDMLSIEPYDEKSLRDNCYYLHNDGYIAFVQEQSNENLTPLTSAIGGASVRIEIPKNGIYLEVGRTYQLRSQETIQSEYYSCSVAPCDELVEMGVISNTDSNIRYDGGGYQTINLVCLRPMIIKPGDAIAKLYFTEKEPGTGYVPIGGIIMWTGELVPDGYYLCDGENGTPDLRNRFVMGGVEAGAVGGNNIRSHDIREMPSHNHGYIATAVGETVRVPRYVPPETGEEYYYDVVSKLEYSTDRSNSTGGGGSFDNRPAFYQLAFIMRYR